MERILLLFLVGLLGYLVYLIFEPFLVPLAWGVALTLVFFPVHRRLRRYIKQPNLAALVSTLLLTTIIIAPTLVVMGAVTTQALQLVDHMENEWEAGRLPLAKLWSWIPFERVLDWLARHGVSEQQTKDYVRKGIENVAGFLAAQTGAVARNILVFFFDLLVMLFAAFYLFRDGSALVERVRLALPFDDSYREGLFYIAHNMLYASVISGLLVAVVQGILGGLTFWALGIKAPLVWGLAMTFFAFLPIVGPWVVYVPAIVYFVATEEYAKAIILGFIGVVVISSVDNVLRPILVSGRSQMNGLLVFVSLLGGVAAFGFLGLILGPILVALADAAVEVYAAQQAKQRLAAASG
ncbi:MAG TPA: AI-2E family transporter [Candidatus Acidoferrales bacterium]|nr:AI-2E family transporter [Candidatus Acidoferrales bacterium]